MPGRVFTDSERKRLDAFPSEIAELDLIRYFTLSGSDLEFVKKQRGDHNRLGFALQLCGLRYLGFCPDDLVTAPPADFRRRGAGESLESEAFIQRSSTIGRKENRPSFFASDPPIVLSLELVLGK